MELGIGLSGAALILAAFILNELHIWNEDDLVYDLINLAGGALLVWYSWLITSWPFAILNGVWTLVALRDVFLDVKRKRPARVIQ